jgi:hypothetical protein
MVVLTNQDPSPTRGLPKEAQIVVYVDSSDIAEIAAAAVSVLKVV